MPFTGWETQSQVSGRRSGTRSRASLEDLANRLGIAGQVEFKGNPSLRMDAAHETKPRPGPPAIGQ